MRLKNLISPLVLIVKVDRSGGLRGRGSRSGRCIPTRTRGIGPHASFNPEDGEGSSASDTCVLPVMPWDIQTPSGDFALHLLSCCTGSSLFRDVVGLQFWLSCFRSLSGFLTPHALVCCLFLLISFRQSIAQWLPPISRKQSLPQGGFEAVSALLRFVAVAWHGSARGGFKRLVSQTAQGSHCTGS